MSALAIQEDGRILVGGGDVLSVDGEAVGSLVGGRFNKLDGVPVSGLVRLDGTGQSRHRLQRPPRGRLRRRRRGLR